MKLYEKNVKPHLYHCVVDGVVSPFGHEFKLPYVSCK